MVQERRPLRKLIDPDPNCGFKTARHSVRPLCANSRRAIRGALKLGAKAASAIISLDYPGKFRVRQCLKRPIGRFRLEALRRRRRYHPQVIMRATLPTLCDYVLPVSVGLSYPRFHLSHQVSG